MKESKEEERTRLEVYLAVFRGENSGFWMGSSDALFSKATLLVEVRWQVVQSRQVR